MKKLQEDYPLLIAQEGPLKGQRWQLSQTIVLGRESTCDVTIVDRQISRFHARLTPTSEGVILEDLGRFYRLPWHSNSCSSFQMPPRRYWTVRPRMAG
jgi:pSer/pThr/pTyr-binding forkhead associated (FHA) protein